ncbi:MAG: sugar O-acetyltransferase [Treponema sp.]|nr:sugar O-acetyltransferase [Treponema sp.]
MRGPLLRAVRRKGLIYHYGDPGITGERLKYMEKLYDYNATRPLEQDKRRRLLKGMFAEIGDNCHIETPLHANWGCHHVHFGNGIYCSFNITLLDDMDIYIGDNCVLAPNVVVSTVDHPLFPTSREDNCVFTFPVRIGKNIWISSGVQILPGVTIGDNAVIGAGSVVTNSIPPNVIAIGVPCRVIRGIEEKGGKYFFKDKALDVWERDLDRDLNLTNPSSPPRRNREKSGP